MGRGGGESATKLTVSILKQDPNTLKVKKNADFKRTKQKRAHFGGKPLSLSNLPTGK